MAVFINEIHYDNTGTDAGEFIEIAGDAGTDLTGWQIVLYNGATGATYDTFTFGSITIPEQGGAFGTVATNYAVNGIQNDTDGIALVDDLGNVVQFLSYEGTFAATNGPATGMTSTNIGVAESAATPVGHSLQLTGTGTQASDFTWAAPAVDTPGASNTGQVFNGATLSVGDTTVVEGTGGTTTMEFTVTLNGSDPGGVSVDFATGGASATASVDYDPVSGTLNFAGTDGETQTISVNIIPDALLEGPETLVMNLSNITANQTTINDGLGVGTIVNDDPIVVNSTADNTTVDGFTTLREALILANADPDHSDITFDPGVFAGNATITLNGTELDITTALSIDGDSDGDGDNDVTIDGDGTSRVFGVDLTGAASIDALTLTNGSETVGGAVRVINGDVTITSTTISNNVATTGSGGGVFVVTGTSLTLQDSLLVGNTANQFGGGVYLAGGMGNISNTTITGNTATGVGGAGVDSNLGDLTLTNSTITGNTGFGLFLNGGAATLRNNITSENSDGDDISIFSLTESNNIFGGSAVNLFAAIDGVNGGGTLADNGGPVQTIALREDVNNPALDAGSDAFASATDARGLGRVNQTFVANNGGNTSDLGAFEVQTNIPVNQPASLTLDILLDSLPEDADTSTRIKLADVVITDDGLGTNDLSLRGADSGSFELDGTELFLRADAVLDFEREEELDVLVEVDDATVGADPDDSEAFTLSVTDVNEAPEVAVDNVVNPLAEDLDTSAAVKVADIEVLDDALGTNTLSLSGADAGLFSIVGDELFLNAGTALDFESQTSLSVSIDVDDADVGATPDDSAALVFDIEDVNEAPSVSLENVIGGVSETSFLSGRVKVADVVITDDALGTNVLGLAGPNRFLFQLDGDELFIRAGQPLDFETQDPLEVTVVVSDPSLPGQDSSVVATLTLLDVNEAPSGVSVIVPDVEVPEDTDTTEPVKVGDIVIDDDAVGDNMLSLSGPDAGLFEVVGTELFLTAGAALDFETNPDLQVTVTLDDPNFPGVEGTADVIIAIGDVNEPPSVALPDPLTDLAEDADTSARIKVADIDVSDDTLGTNTLDLAGADAALFEIDGTELFLIAGAALDFETNPALDVVLTVDDPTLGTDVEDTSALSLAITDVDEPATLALTPVLTELAEDADTAARIKVADITITDDALGTNTLTLAGADAALFEIDGTELFLIAGAALDFETDAQLDVAVTLDGTDVSAPLRLAITDVDEPPTLALLNALTEIAEDADTSARIKVADIDVSDDALGTATLGLTGADASLFEIDGAELFMSAGVALDFESTATLEVSVTVDDPALGVDPDDSVPLSLAVSDANEAPTLALTPVLSELGDDADTTARIKVADIAITDDALGTNTLALVGADAALFEIDGAELFLIAGAVLTAPTLDIAVTLDDPDFAGLEGSEALALSITQTNAAPSVTLTNVISDLDEDTDTAAPVFVADIVVTDDVLGTNALSLGGTDAALFEITGDQVFLKAGTVLDFETLANLTFEVNVDDATVGATPDESASASIAVNDVNEAPAVTLTPVATETLSSKAPVAERQLVATIAITDDALGTANLALAGADADLFEIDGMELFLKGGLDLQGRTASDLEVDVNVNDPALGAGDTGSFSLPVINVYFPGTPGDDLLTGTQFADLFEGFAGDDTLVGLGEGDTLDGGAGTDTATLAAPQENHTITFGADGTLIEDRSEAGGPDTLIDMEALLFADDRLAAPTAGTPLDLTLFDGVLDVSAAQLAALSLIYIGFYDRAPDAPGLFYWATQLANGMSLEDIAQEFLDAPELFDVFGETPDTMTLVTTAYNNLLDRDEDATGSTFWNDLVGDGVIGADEFLFLFAAGTEAGGSDRQILDDQTDVALYFSAIQGLSDTTDATAALAAYDATDRATSLQIAQTLIDGFVADVTSGTDPTLLMRVTGVLDDPFAIA